MAVNSDGYILLPYDSATLTGAFTALTAISAIGDKFATVFQAPVTGSLTQLQFLAGAVTTGNTVDVRLETVTTGDPSGTLKATTTNAAVGLGAANTMQIATLTSAYSVTQGELCAMTIVNGNPASNFQVRKTVGGYSTGFPYSDRSITGTWTKSTNPIMGAMKIDSVYYPFGPSGLGLEATATAVTNINNGSAVIEQGNQFVANSSYRVVGFYGNFTVTGASNTFDVILYEGTGNSPTAVLTKTVQPDARQASGTNQHHFFGSSYTLKPGQTYRIVQKPTSANNVGIDTLVWGSGLSNAYAGFSNYLYAMKASPSAWSTQTEQVGMIGVICEGISALPIGRLTGVTQSFSGSSF